ncbi:MAG TPA: hypothetical protein VMT91_00550 [Anaerolineales bacterium]|nr:hypothetical protein [Anaerolineales bacterium]
MAPNLTRVNPQMEKLATNAVIAARDKFGLVLDFSEGSLLALEDLLQKAHEGYRDGYKKSLANGDPINVTLEYTVRIWGSYFGEVVRRSLGGDWVVDQKEVFLKFAPGRLDSLGEGSSRVLIVDHKNVFLQIESRRLDPLGQVRSRIIGGPLYNLPDFFTSLRNRLQRK